MDCLPLVSVIITTYNYACYLPKAIKSVLDQTYSNIEIIVIDDGSTDETALVMRNYPEIQYYFQHNKGISAARNYSIRKSKGRYLVFLDADDWLLSDAIESNLSVIIQHSEFAFVSGNYLIVRAEIGVPEKIEVTVSDNHYVELLQRNYIGMIGAVMFAQWVLQEIQYDEKLSACEDYDLYLRIAKHHRVVHHQKVLATYYYHKHGLSHNYKIMMEAMMSVMKKQFIFIQTHKERIAYEVGMQQWKDYYLMMADTA